MLIPSANPLRCDALLKQNMLILGISYQGPVDDDDDDDDEEEEEEEEEEEDEDEDDDDDDDYG